MVSDIASNISGIKTSKYKKVDCTHSFDKISQNGPRVLDESREKLHLCYQKGKRDHLLFTTKRILWVDGEGRSAAGKFAAALFGGSGTLKRNYHSFMWHHLVGCDVETAGTWEGLSNLLSRGTADSELDLIFTFGKRRFEFKKDQDILYLSRYINSMIASEPMRELSKKGLGKPKGLDTIPKSFTAKTEGRLRLLDNVSKVAHLDKLLFEGETALYAFQVMHGTTHQLLGLTASAKDFVVVTDKRFIEVDKKKRGDKKTEFRSVPWPHGRSISKIAAWGVRSVGAFPQFDMDSEFYLMTSESRYDVEFTRDTDIFVINKMMQDIVLQ